MDLNHNRVMLNGQTLCVSKYHRADLAIASANRNNGTRKQNARGPGGAQVVVMGDVDDKWGAFWVADCNRTASILINAGYEGLPRD